MNANTPILINQGKVEDNHLQLLPLHAQDGIQSLLEEGFRLETTFRGPLLTWVIRKYCCRRLLYRVVS